MADVHPLKRYRDDKQMTQIDLARELGVDPMTISRWERGTRAPRRRDLSRIASITGLQPAEIINFGADRAAAE